MLRRLAMILILVLFAQPALAQDAADQSSGSGLDAVSTLWVLMAAFMVFLMQAGFGMVEAGFIRSKNAANVLMKNVLDFCFAALGFFVFGYAIMYGGEGLLFGTSGWLRLVAIRSLYVLLMRRWGICSLLVVMT